MCMCGARRFVFYSARKIYNVITGLHREVVLTLKDGSDKLSRNVGKELPLHAA